MGNKDPKESKDASLWARSACGLLSCFNNSLNILKILMDVRKFYPRENLLVLVFFFFFNSLNVFLREIQTLSISFPLPEANKVI